MKKNKILKDTYEVNEETLALIPISDNKVLVYEKDESFELCNNATSIMEDSCLYFGSSLDGRRRGTESLIGVTYKAPIIVEETKELIFFPTASSRKSDTSWIGLKNLKDYYRDDDGIVIVFHNGQELKLDVSYGVMDNQILRATRLESVLRGRKTKKIL